MTDDYLDLSPEMRARESEGSEFVSNTPIPLDDIWTGSAVINRGRLA